MAQDLVGLTDYKIVLNKLSPQQTFTNREGLDLSYRFYSSWSDRLLIFYHGIGGDSRYVGALANYLAQNNLASVLTPDFRGHGKSRAAVADVTSAESLLQDLQDLVHHAEAHYPDKELSIGGHSLGGGFALKAMTDETLKKYFKSVIALSPYLHYLFADETGPRFSSWLKLDASKNQIDLQMPDGYKSGNEVLSYSLDFFKAASINSPIDFEKLKTVEHMVVIASEGDQLSPAARYQAVMGEEAFHLNILKGYSHMGQVMAQAAQAEIAQILQKELLWA